MNEKSNHLVDVLINNGIALQNAVNQYAHQATGSIKKADAIIYAATKLDSRLNSICNEIMRLRKESAEENKRLRKLLGEKVSRK